MIKSIDPELHLKISKYLGEVPGRRDSEVKRHLLPETPTYSAGKLRIRNGGDVFRTRHVSKRSGVLERKNCYVRVRPLIHIKLDNND